MATQTNEPSDFDTMSDPVAQKAALAITKLGIATKSHAWKEAGPEGMTPTQGQVLGLLRLRAPEPLRLAEIASGLAVKPSTASEAVDALVVKGFTTKARSASDARALAVSLTESGRQMALRSAGWSDFLAQGLKALSGEELEVFYRGLLKVIRVLQHEGQIPISRMCVTCTYFRPNVHSEGAKPHHCALVDAPFGDRHLRLECAEHIPASEAQAEESFAAFARPMKSSEPPRVA